MLYAHDMRAALAHADGKVFLTAPRDAMPPDLEGLVEARTGGAAPPQSGTCWSSRARAAKREWSRCARSRRRRCTWTSRWSSPSAAHTTRLPGLAQAGVELGRLSRRTVRDRVARPVPQPVAAPRIRSLRGRRRVRTPAQRRAARAGAARRGARHVGLGRAGGPLQPQRAGATAARLRGGRSAARRRARGARSSTRTTRAASSRRSRRTSTARPRATSASSASATRTGTGYGC